MTTVHGASVVSVKTKHQALDSMRQKEAAMAARIDTVLKTGEIDADPEAVQGCGGRFFCGLLGRRRRDAARGAAAVAAAAGAEQRTRTGFEARVFGQKGKGTDAAQRLNHAADSLSAHVDQLGERARAARAKAQELFAASKRPEAMAALKRAKLLEKQLESATATHAALERQVDVLAESELQKEVASALSASVASTKKKTKGLLGKTESAVDGASELKDFADDIAQTLGGLQTEAFDDDDLLEELQAMQAGGEIELEEARPAAAKPAAAKPAAPPIAVDASKYPKVPSKIIEKRKLLDDQDGPEAQAEHL